MGKDQSGLRYTDAGLIASLLLFVLIFLTPCTGQAQSGRSPKRGESPTANAPTVEATATRYPKPSEQLKLSLLTFDYVPSPNVMVETGWVYRSFLERLEESPRLTVTGQNEMRRKDAIDQAKSQKEQFVVWLQLEVDLAPRDFEEDAERAAIKPINPGCLFVTYAAFEPVTGKVLAQGHVYQPGFQSRCVGGAYHPSPYPDGSQSRRLPPEYLLKQAGRETADRVMIAFDIPLPPKHP